MMVKSANVAYSIIWSFLDYFIEIAFMRKSRWVGPRPLSALWYKFLWQSGFRPNREQRFSILDFQSLKEIQATTTYFKDQQIEPNAAAEEQLLEKSTLWFYPHEVYQVRIHNSQNVEFASKIFHGHPHKSSDLEELKRLINHTAFRARKIGLIVEEVELIHTHPSLELIISDKIDPKFVFNGLSRQDKKTGNLLAQFCSYPLRVKAVTPSANYSMLF